MMNMNGRDLALSIIVLLLVFDAQLIASEGEVGPYTITTGYDNTATRIEQQRKTFRNPRGLGYFYALVETDLRVWYFFKSLDGVTWVNTNIRLNLAGYPGWVGHPSLCIWEDSDRLIVWVTFPYWTSGDQVYNFIYVECYQIDDATSNPSFIWYLAPGVRSDDAVHNPVICLDANGHLWIAWIDEYTGAGKQRYRVHSRATIETYPIDDSPTWTSVSAWTDGFRGDDQISKVSIVPISAIGDIGIVLAEAVQSKSYVYYLAMRTGTYSAGVINLGTAIYPDLSIHSDMLFSIVPGTDGSVLILYRDLTSLKTLKWLLPFNYAGDFGIVYSGDVGSLALSVDKRSDLEKAYAFYTKVGVPGYLFYKMRPIDGSELWSDEATISDDSETLGFLSSSYEDSNKDSRIQLIYTRQATDDVRFVEVGPEAEEEGPPVIFPSTGHKVTAFTIGSMFLVVVYLRRRRED